MQGPLVFIYGHPTFLYIFGQRYTPRKRRNLLRVHFERHLNLTVDAYHASPAALTDHGGHREEPQQRQHQVRPQLSPAQLRQDAKHGGCVRRICNVPSGPRQQHHHHQHHHHQQQQNACRTHAQDGPARERGGGRAGTCPFSLKERTFQSIHSLHGVSEPPIRTTS